MWIPRTDITGDCFWSLVIRSMICSLMPFSFSLQDFLHLGILVHDFWVKAFPWSMHSFSKSEFSVLPSSLFCYDQQRHSCEEDIWPGDSLYMQHKFLYWLEILRYNSSFLWLHVYSPFLTVQRPVKHTSWMFCSIISPMISYSTEYCLVSEVYMLELETTH